VGYNDDEIIKGILHKDDAVMEHLYLKYLPMVKFFVCSNSGNEDDANDVFQEAVIVLFRKISEGDLVLTSSFKTYLYSVCRNIWLKELVRRKGRSEDLMETNAEIVDSASVDVDEYLTTERAKLFQRHFINLSQDCQKVLVLFLRNRLSLKEIARIMGYKSEKYAKKRKYQCKETLMERIQADPTYKDTLEENFTNF